MPIIPIALVGLVLWGATKLLGKKGPKVPKTGEGAPPKEWHDAIVSVTDSGDPRAMLELAKQLDAEGYSQAAADLRANAQVLQSAQRAGVRHPDEHVVPAVPAGQGTGFVAPPPASITTPVNAPPNGLSVAIALAKHLASTGRGKENQEYVKAFERQEKLKVDGHYGIDNAKHIAAYGVVPPAPYYWPKQHTESRKREYRQFLLDKAGTDPAQASAWIAAADAVK